MMNPEPGTQAQFAAALREADLPMPQGLCAWNGPDPARRFEVYRNNVRQGLLGALSSRFPAVERIVGRDFFTLMASEFISVNPPRSPVLLAYGEAFPDFVAQFEAARSLVWLADVARLEWARGQAYHAADAVPLAATAFAALAPEALGDAVLTPHPSLCLLSSPFPVATLWAMNADEMPLAPITDWSGEDALIVRPHGLVRVYRLPPGAHAFFSALSGGESLGESAETALAAMPDFDLTAALALLIEAEAFIALHVRETSDAR